MPDLEQVKFAVTDAPIEEVILKRWSPRAFADRQVSADDLKTIFTAGSWAASSRNEQPWRFIIGIKQQGDDTYLKLLRALVPSNQSWAKQAPVLYASFAKKTFSHDGSPNGSATHDVGAASATISLQAAALGLHTHGMGGFDKELLRASFGVPSDFDPVACWALGYLGDPENLPDNYKVPEQQPRDRKSLSDFVFSDWEKSATL